jgi:hypothetical protein
MYEDISKLEEVDIDKCASLLKNENNTKYLIEMQENCFKIIFREVK